MHIKNIFYKKNSISGGRRDGSATKGMYCSCKGPKFSFQHHIRQLKTACDSISRGIWCLLASTGTSTHTTKINLYLAEEPKEWSLRDFERKLKTESCVRVQQQQKHLKHWHWRCRRTTEDKASVNLKPRLRITAYVSILVLSKLCFPPHNWFPPPAWVPAHTVILRAVWDEPYRTLSWRPNAHPIPTASINLLSSQIMQSSLSGHLQARHDVFRTL